MKLCCLFTLSHYPPGHPNDEQKVNCLCGAWWRWEGQKDGWRPYPDDERRKIARLTERLEKLEDKPAILVSEAGTKEFGSAEEAQTEVFRQMKGGRVD